MQLSGITPAVYAAVESKTAPGGAAGIRTVVEAKKKLDKLASDFESIFVNMLMEKMRGSEKGNALFGNSPGHRMFSEMQDEHYARELSKQQLFGIGKMITERFKSHLELYETSQATQEARKEK
jgi:Rod binding domain-containing protein